MDTAGGTSLTFRPRLTGADMIRDRNTARAARCAHADRGRAPRALHIRPCSEDAPPAPKARRWYITPRPAQHPYIVA